MWYRNRWMIVVLIIAAALTLTACGAQTTQTAEGSSSSQPARVERTAGTDLSRVILSAQAAKRLGIETVPVQDAQVQGKLRKVVPYAAVFYDLNGKTWVYTNPDPLTFVRASISVDSIDGDLAVLSEGPPSGTQVVIVGAPELYGTEFGVGQ
jgi:hypothetical protein